MNSDQVRAELARLTGTSPIQLHPLGGGDVCQAYRADLAGTSVFVKTRAGAPASFFRSEGLGLEWLAAAEAVHVPAVLARGDDVLVLEWLEPAVVTAAAAERLGRDLAALHRSGAASFGADWPGFIGPLAQDNGPFANWAELFARGRVQPFIRQAVAAGALAMDGASAVERLLERLDAVGGPPEPPSRLHGDLWAGNVVWTSDGGTLVDPAAHGGHRETDLAMLALFGAPFLDVIVAAYDEVFPLSDGWRDRVGLHQLPPLLVHAVLFGGSYGARAATVAASYL